MQSLNTLALVKGTFFRVSVLFDLSPKYKNNKNNKVRCKLTLRFSKNKTEIIPSNIVNPRIQT